MSDFQHPSESGDPESRACSGLITHQKPGGPLANPKFTQPQLASSEVDGQALKLSILMPAYNEERTIIKAISEVLKAHYPCEVELIVIDDGSTDNTWLLLSQVSDSRVILHRHRQNKGKGAALLSAISLATGTYVIPFDADLEYIPADIPRLLEPILMGRCKIVYGVRLFGYNTVYQTYRYAVGNRILTRLANVLFDAHLSDLHTCLKLVPISLLRRLDLRETGFGLDTEVTALLLKRGFRPFEVPISYYSRSHDEGKKITWRDAVKCVSILLKVRMRINSNEKPSSGSDAPQIGQHASVVIDADAMQTVIAAHFSKNGDEPV